MKRLLILSLLLWVCVVFYVGIYLFVGGFLLVRLEVNRTSTCGDVLHPGEEQGDFCHVKPRFRRAVLLIIDALKIDFARFDPTNATPRHYENKLPVLEETASSRPSHSRLYPFRADPPTTTMQRIKGFTTGSLPTFIDVGNNFASSAILEDNLIHQLGQIGKRVVFMGDDTWESLFPKKFYRSLPFPSFNVKDLHTVDDGILQHLYPTMVSDDWDVLVAHFLGVDHCGHRFGPDHPAMADKLTQMDGVIRSVIERLENDTLLVVMGDHGMTDTGDHGGESQKETDAAIFLYSPSPLFPKLPFQSEPDVVPQTDLVPTLALLLGVPIPYSSVGQVLLPLFPPHGQTEGAVGGLSQLEALWINAKQVNRFLKTYSGMAKDIPAESLSKLQDVFSRVSSDYLSTVGKGQTPSPELAASLQAYLTSVRDTCRATWARFSPLKMAAGLAILAFACLLCFILSELSCVLIRENVLRAPVVAALSVGVCVAAGQLFTQGYIEVAWCLAAAALSSELLFLWRAHRVRTSVVAGNGSKAPKRANWLTLRHLLVPPLLVSLLRCASLLSDSYVIAEGRVVTFLVFSLSLYIPIHLNWDGLLLPPSHDPLKPAGLLPSPALSPSAVRKESSTLVACLGLLVGSLYLSLSFHGCREEQGTCQPSPFLSPLSRLQDNKLKNLHYVLSLASLGLWTYLLRRWLRHYGNLNSSGGTVFTARVILPLLSVCLGLHWAVSATPEDSFRNLADLISLAQLALPRAAFCLLGLGLLLIWLDPLTVFVKTRTVAPARGSSLPPPRYRASTGISPQAELHHLIPQIYQRMRRSLEDGELSGGAELDSRPAVEAYGLGTVYSAPLLLFCGLLGIGLLLLHPEGMALSFLLLLLQTGALLHIHASSTALNSLHGAHSGGFDVPWTPVVLWSLAATQFFHATGHLPTFPSIQWNAAFVGFPGGHTGTILPASLVTLNTFASHILFAAGCPLLLFWPLVCEVRGSRGVRAVGEDGEDAVMEMRLRENPQQFSSALLQLSTRYLFILGAQVFASVCAAAILRRHLMVWKVFAPKLMFEASGFLVSCVFLLIGVTLVSRVDMAVGRWFKRLLPDESR
ncbi:GPI ethanolamine phosphate transferase 3 [Myripristis murdjan]|uniref:GPI ethanolamine phosphate transferase 3, catalytic subunit n=1 Tax=Myripristis murdjan TaxID=586833 RepID=A0A667ZWD7_9TELE|nr:GPI ethanolamine phosphate transferase 3 [Myripristis murdjan]XP_029921448.1 GPI ethanolamine phosphate transferase 3 [Myripristis murdjan]XP_029921449.1 GPI ethanolamine phosphate transferase 3 [Myripristis murdjan]